MSRTADLSDRLHPMTVKELQQSMRRASFVYPFLGIQLLAVAAMAMEFANQTVHRSQAPGLMNLHMVLQSGPFWTVAFWVCGVIMPLGGLILMTQELDEGNHELLLLTSLNRWAVVRGKFVVLWAVSSLSLISLLPYVVVRYFIGGIEMWQELMCSLSVIGTAAVMSAGALGASAYKNMVIRILVLLLFLGSFSVCAAMVLLSSAAVTRYEGVDFHLFVNLNGLAAVICFSIIGLAIARSRLRLAVHAFEVKPSRMLIGLLFFTPFVCGITTAISVGHAGMIGLVAVIFICLHTDVTLKLKSRPKSAGAVFTTGHPLPPTLASPRVIPLVPSPNKGATECSDGSKTENS